MDALKMNHRFVSVFSFHNKINFFRKFKTIFREKELSNACRICWERLWQSKEITSKKCMSVSSRSSTSVSGFDESCKGGRNGLILLTRPRGYSASFDCCCLEDYWSISWGYSLFFYCKNNEMNIISGFVLALNIWYNKYGLDRIEQTHCGLFFTDLKQSS